LDIQILAATALAGAAYTLTPGPAFLALLGIGAAQGRIAGAGFLCGHFVGDMVWASLALLAIIGTASLGTLVFDVLGAVCGLYLMWLGIKALATRQRADGAINTHVRRPLVRGLIFGLTNPKGYPVAVAMFTALLANRAGMLDWTGLPVLLAAAAAGFIIADMVLVAVVGAGGVRRIYRRHELWIVRASGAIFVGFAVHALAHALPGLWGRRP
jgi:threonine/homoserine/homoserine lactone efflux protein